MGYQSEEEAREARIEEDAYDEGWHSGYKDAVRDITREPQTVTVKVPDRISVKTDVAKGIIMGGTVLTAGYAIIRWWQNRPANVERRARRKAEEALELERAMDELRKK